LISAIELSITAGVVFAASVHYKNAPPTDTRSRDKLTLQVCGALSGLGNVDVRVTVTANARPTATCTNKGGTAAPGQNPAEVTVTGATTIPADKIKNGNVSFCVTTSPPQQPTWDQAGCANANWSAQINCMAFSGYTITVEQPIGNVVLGPTAFAASSSSSSCP
jgi:hypothetical protein